MNRLVSSMDIDRFKSRDAGRLVETWYEDKPYLAFVPHPLPPKLHLDNELLLALSEQTVHWEN
jgi:hypothetical protein